MNRSFCFIRLESHVLQDHLLRGIDAVFDFGGLRKSLAPHYSSTGRPSIDPELMLRILLVGYLFGVRSERRLCEEVHLNLAYRWFCRLDQDPACERLMTVPGIGPIVSSAMVAAIGNGTVFSKGRDFGAWLGLVPKQISTGDRTILGKISKRGNRYLRVLFVQAAWVVLVKPKSWERYGLKPWIEAARRRLHHNVLAIALANRLARIAWAVLNKERNFECGKTSETASRSA
jgi:hypothetical protein